MAKYAVVDKTTGDILNVVSWDGVSNWSPSEPNVDVILLSGSHGPGDKYHKSNTTFQKVERPEFIPPPINKKEVDEERDNRITGGFMFNGKLFQSRVQDQKRMNGAGTLALAAIVNGAQPKDYRWHGGVSDFTWITDDNTLMPLDAFDVVALGKAAANWESLHVFAARTLKDTDPIPQDYKKDIYWPTP
jgi:hypothetical protein